MLGSPVSAVRRAIPPLGLMLAVLVAGVVLSPAIMWGYDSDIARQVAHSMVTERTFRVYNDGLGINVPYASYGIGLSLLMVIPELVGSPLGRSPLTLNTLINPILLALIALVIWVSARRCGVTTRQATVVSLCLALATPLLPYATTTFSEIGVSLGVAMGILGILIAKDRGRVGGLIAGTGIGVAALMRPDSFLLVAPVVAIGAVMASRPQWRTAMAGVAIAAMPAIAITALYNMARFSSPLTSQYAGFDLSDSFVTPFWTGFYGLTASPGRGIILYAPIVLSVAIGMRWAWQRSPLLTTVCLALLVSRLLFYATWWSWAGGTGWGPRFLVPAMPALLPFVLEIVRRLEVKPRSTATATASLAFAGLLVVSLGIQVVGAATDVRGDGVIVEALRRDALVPSGDLPFMTRATTSPMLAATTDPFMDWSLFPIRENAQELLKGRTLMSRYLEPRVRTLPLTLAAVIFLVGLSAALSKGNRPEELSDGQT
ncbi:MAG TPA: hypothetical protein VM121_10120 [Acidimicrobiales bacterium]|nr:hypothetical protein [Acidimicrobiales bacterium]